MMCKHNWELLSETITKSKFETAVDAIRDRATSLNIPWQMSHADRKHIQIVTCKKCGKLKRFVEDI